MKNLEKLLQFLREKRGFNAKEVLAKKLELINNFFREENLDACVVGISGGIDSALVLNLLHEASKLENSPIKKIRAMLLPIYGNGTTNQNTATEQGLNVIKNMMYEESKVYYTIKDLTNAYNGYLSNFGKPFANGQLASIVRTPMLYYEAALLQEEGFNSIVVGTTNLSEGGYIGFYGKASDAMVDLQPISDLYKSEVYELSKLLNIHESVINAIPAGDVFDGRNDEQMIGAPYWFLELYMNYDKNFDKNFNINYINEIENICNQFTEEEANLWNTYVSNIEALHSKNIHKYKVGSPSRNINILQ